MVVNLYPFEQTIAKGNVTRDEAIEQIDIGGPSMIRSAAKNHSHVAVLTDPAQYADFAKELDAGEGTVPQNLLRKLAVAAFERTSRYDQAIYNYLAKAEGNAEEDLPATGVSFEQARRYVDWLSQRTGRRYRLPSKAEAERLASAAGTKGNTLERWAGYAPNPEDAARIRAALGELERAGRAPVAGGGARLQAALARGDQRDLRHGEEAVQQDQEEEDCDFHGRGPGTKGTIVPSA